jgi:hypothetical protein
VGSLSAVDPESLETSTEERATSFEHAAAPPCAARIEFAAMRAAPSHKRRALGDPRDMR